MGLWFQDRMISWVKVPLKHLFKSCPGVDYTTLGSFRTFTKQGKVFFFHKGVTFSSNLKPVKEKKKRGVNSLHREADY